MFQRFIQRARARRWSRWKQRGCSGMRRLGSQHILPGDRFFPIVGAIEAIADPVTSYAWSSIRRFPVGATLLCRLVVALVACMLAAGLWSAPTLASPPSLSWSSPMLIDHQQPYTSNRAFAGVSCPSSSLCVAVDRDGNVATSTDPGAAAATSWAVKDVDVNNELTSVSCPSSSFCAAVDYGGDVLTSTDPTGALRLPGGSSTCGAPRNWRASRARPRPCAWRLARATTKAPRGSC